MRYRFVAPAVDDRRGARAQSDVPAAARLRLITPRRARVPQLAIEDHGTSGGRDFTARAGLDPEGRSDAQREVARDEIRRRDAQFPEYGHTAILDHVATAPPHVPEAPREPRAQAQLKARRAVFRDVTVATGLVGSFRSVRRCDGSSCFGRCRRRRVGDAAAGQKLEADARKIWRRSPCACSRSLTHPSPRANRRPAGATCRAATMATQLRLSQERQRVAARGAQETLGGRWASHHLGMLGCLRRLSPDPGRRYRGLRDRTERNTREQKARALDLVHLPSSAAWETRASRGPMAFAIWQRQKCICRTPCFVGACSRSAARCCGSWLPCWGGRFPASSGVCRPARAVPRVRPSLYCASRSLAPCALLPRVPPCTNPRPPSSPPYPKTCPNINSATSVRLDRPTPRHQPRLAADEHAVPRARRRSAGRASL